MLENAATEEDPARIINIGSVDGLMPQEAPTHAYDASKAAVHNMTKKFAADLAPKHITGEFLKLSLYLLFFFTTNMLVLSQLSGTWFCT